MGKATITIKKNSISLEYSIEINEKESLSNLSPFIDYEVERLQGMGINAKVVFEEENPFNAAKFIGE